MRTADACLYSKPDLHYDFMHIGISDDGFSYLLVIKDNYSSFTDLVPCESPTSNVVVDALLRWYGLFGIASVHMSDQGSHFKNSVIQQLNRRMATKHYFTLPYTPWSNGTIERVIREIRKLIRVWNSEFRITLKSWPLLVPLMMHVLNFSPSPRLQVYPPALVFGGFTTSQNLDVVFQEQKFRESLLSFEKLTRHVEELRKSLDELHRKIDDVPTRRGNYNLIRNRPNFDRGDFVMFATRRNDTGPSRRSMTCWTGTYRILECISDWEFVIQHLVTKERVSFLLIVHG